MQPTRMPDGSRKLLTDQAYEAVRDLILSGELASGRVLSKRQIALQLNVSKTPVDAALERLAAEGLVTISPRQGFAVREPSFRGLADLFELRLALEPYVMRQLAGKVTPIQAQKLLANTEAQAEAAREGDVSLSVRLDTEFHLMPCHFLGNGEILRAMHNLMGKLHQTMAWVVRRDPERMGASPREHVAIAKALIDGDHAGAVREVESHLLSARQHITA